MCAWEIPHCVWVMRMCERSSSSRFDVSVAVILFHNFRFASDEMKWQKWWDAKNWIKFIYMVYEIPFDLLSNQWSIHWMCVLLSECVRVKLFEKNSSISDKNNCLKNKLSIGILKFCTVIDSNENWQLLECVRVCVSLSLWCDVVGARGGDDQMFVAKTLVVILLK